MLISKPSKLGKLARFKKISYFVFRSSYDKPEHIIINFHVLSIIRMTQEVQEVESYLKIIVYVVHINMQCINIKSILLKSNLKF